MARKLSPLLGADLYYSKGPSLEEWPALREKSWAECKENKRRLDALRQTEEAEKKKQQLDKKVRPKEESMRTIYLVSCVKTKQAGMHAAKDLYTSPWFRMAREYVERTGCPWYILSAKYGLVEPDRVIGSYNVTLKGSPVAHRREWAAKVLVDLRSNLRPSDRVVFFAGVDYRKFLMEEVKRMCSGVEVPMEGLRSGEQCHWLGRQLARR